MNRFQKICLGVATLAPLVLQLWCLAEFLDLFGSIAAQPSVAPGDVGSGVSRILVPAAIGGALHLALFGVHVWRLMSKPPSNESSTVPWLLAMLFLGPFAMLLYWGLEILPDEARRARQT